ncbi:MAG: hypothetical protein ACO1RT_15630 [Planctomycetaceae bacterium]
MMQAETFVGSLAVALAIVSGAAALGPFRYGAKVRLIHLVRQRFGEWPARTFLALIALLLLVSGVMILRDLRPRFAVPLSGNADIGQDSGSR